MADAGDEEALRLVRSLGAGQGVHDDGLRAFSGKHHFDHVGRGVQQRNVVVREGMVHAFEIESDRAPYFAIADDVRKEDRPEVEREGRLVPVLLDKGPVEGVHVAADERAVVLPVLHEALDTGKRPVEHPEGRMGMSRFDIFVDAVRDGPSIFVPDQAAAAGAEELADIFQRAPDRRIEIVFADDVLQQVVDGLLILDQAVHVRDVAGSSQKQTVSAGVLEHAHEGLNVTEVSAAVRELACDLLDAAGRPGR